MTSLWSRDGNVQGVENGLPLAYRKLVQVVRAPGNGFLDSNDLNMLNKKSDQTSGEIARCKLLEK
jgi:hypothetical protein